MRYLGALLLVFWIAGCAHAHLEGWDHTRNQMTVCCKKGLYGNGSCNRDDWQEAVATYCSGRASAVGGYRQITGATSTSRSSGYGSVSGNAYSYSGSGTTNTALTKEGCRVYACSGTINPDGTDEEASPEPSETSAANEELPPPPRSARPNAPTSEYLPLPPAPAQSRAPANEYLPIPPANRR